VVLPQETSCALQAGKFVTGTVGQGFSPDRKIHIHFRFLVTFCDVSCWS
jgi:hypothetical protein